MVADSRIQTYAFDDRLGVQPADCGIGVKFIEETDAQCEVGIGEKLYRLSLGRIHDPDFDVFLQRRILQQIRERFSCLVQPGIADRGADNDPARVQVVIECPAFAEKLRAEQDVVAAILFPDAFREPDRNRAFDDHHGVGIDRDHLLNDGLHARRVKIVELRIVVRRGRNNDEFRILICAVPVRRGFQVEFLRGKILLNLLVDDGRFAGIDHVDLFLDEINGLDRIVLGKQHGHR